MSALDADLQPSAVFSVESSRCLNILRKSLSVKRASCGSKWERRCMSLKKTCRLRYMSAYVGISYDAGPTMRCWMTADLLCELRLRKSPIVNLVNILFNIAASLYTNKSKTNLALQGDTAPALQLVRRANSCNKEAQNPKGPPQASGAGDPSPDLQF